jgi:hypothetical protein
MADVFSAPIPGQSLTDTPKNYPWERPPEIVDPREAIKFHMDGLNQPESLDNLLELIQIGVPVRAIAETTLTTAQMEGIHSVDVSLIIRDVIFEEIVTIAEEAGLDYRTGDEPDEADVREKEEKQVLSLLRKKIGAIKPGSKQDDAGVELMRQTEQTLAGEEEPMMMEQEEPMPQEPRGLMAKG